MAALIRQRAQDGKACVLGLATGSTPVGVYRELIRMHRDEGLSLQNVVTFNLDEYFPIQPDAPQSYVRFMNEHLFDFVDIDRKNIHIPDGTHPLDSVAADCCEYEKQIADAGGIDIQILGIGRTGHIGFNEPGSGRNGLTRLVKLNSLTRNDAAAAFGGLEKVPKSAITMGVKTILSARKIRLLAFGEHKASIVEQAVCGSVSDAVPATFLQGHQDVQFLLDEAAAEKLVSNQNESGDSC
nr:glucosamine-6-phosphate deaminase [Novipirellula aureliae]